VGDAIIGVDLGSFGQRHQALGPTVGSIFLFLFYQLDEDIRIFRTLDWPSRVCGFQGMT